jgi:integrase
LGAWLTAWLADKQESTRYQTFRRYSSLVEHLKAGLGNRPLPELTVADVERFLAAKQHGDPPLSARSVGHLRAVLRAALNDAVRHGHVASNAAQLARPPRMEAKERRDWTPTDRDAFLQALRGTESYAPAATAFYSGLRQGEMLGLRWLDIGADAIHVRHAAIWRDGHSELAEPKSATSRRDVPVSPTLAAVLAAHRQDEEGKRQRLGIPPLNPDDRVFTNAFAAPYNPTVQTHALTRRLRTAGLEPVGFHALRHAFGSILVNSGAEVLTVSRLMGHSGIAVTANVYLRSPRDQMAAAVRLLG